MSNTHYSFCGVFCVCFWVLFFNFQPIQTLNTCYKQNIHCFQLYIYIQIRHHRIAKQMMKYSIYACIFCLPVSLSLLLNKGVTLVSDTIRDACLTRMSPCRPTAPPRALPRLTHNTGRLLKQGCHFVGFGVWHTIRSQNSYWGPNPHRSVVGPPNPHRPVIGTLTLTDQLLGP